MTNTQQLKSRNQREGWYKGHMFAQHMRDKRRWATLKGKSSQFFVEWMRSIGLGR